MVAIEFLRRKSCFAPSTEIYYYKSPEGKEVDFVVKEGLKSEDLLVITWDYEAEEAFKGERIKFVPLWKWLLETRKKNKKKKIFGIVLKFEA